MRLKIRLSNVYSLNNYEKVQEIPDFSIIKTNHDDDIENLWTFEVFNFLQFLNLSGLLL